MFEKKFENEYGNHMARTLDPRDVFGPSYNGECNIDSTFTHESGWTISGYICEDYYKWVNDFQASHPTFGKVWGNFEDVVYADSEAGFLHFVENHEPSEWDYWDI